MLDYLEHFLANHEKYNAVIARNFLEQYIKNLGPEISVTVHCELNPIEFDFYNVLRWCKNNDVDADKLEQAIDLLTSGWVRAKMMEIRDSL